MPSGYSGTPLPKKLGIKEDTVVGLFGAPAGFEATLGALPTGAVCKASPHGQCDLLIWFPRSTSDLERRAAVMQKRVGPGGIWIAWPKQASDIETDLTREEVRRVGLAHALVDYKVAALDEDYSGLKFARRK